MALLMMLLVVPFRINLELGICGGQISGCYRVSWAGLTLRRCGLHLPSEGSAEKPLSERYGDVRRHAADPEELLELIRPLLRLFGMLRRAVELQMVSCRASIGLSDPADTAALYGLLMAASAGLASSRMSFRLEPSFQEERLEVEAAVQISSRMIMAAAVVVRAIQDREIRRILMRGAR